MIHQGEDQRDIPALVGQAFEGAEVGHRVVKSAERKKDRGRLRPCSIKYTLAHSLLQHTACWPWERVSGDSEPVQV